jgi:PIN domain nuclease of toxin-antitoxin system
VIYLDTHVALWLASGHTRAIPSSILAMIEARRVLLSPIAALEMDLLHEIGRISAPSAAILSTLARSLGLALCDLAFAEVTREATALTWTRDPFDRLITAQAQARQAPLATADGIIRKHYAGAVWD